MTRLYSKSTKQIKFNIKRDFHTKRQNFDKYWPITRRVLVIENIDWYGFLERKEGGEGIVHSTICLNKSNN